MHGETICGNFSHVNRQSGPVVPFPTWRRCYVVPDPGTAPIPTPAPDRPRAPPPEHLLKPLERLLRPLVRLLIRSGVTFPVFADLLRGLYVDVALRDLLTDPGARTDSRVSLLTGVHRKEIRRLRTPDPSLEATTPAVVTLASEIIARWLAAPGYADAAHRALPLPRGGPAPSFEALVASVTRDLRARAVLDDWLDQGLVTLDAEGLVRLSADAFLPREGSEAQLFYFGRNLHDHIAAAAANLASPAAGPFLDRSVHYDRLSPEAAERLEAAAREAARRLLLEVNRAALGIAEADDRARGAEGTAPGPTRRVNLGVYLYAEDEPPPGGGAGG